MLSDVDETLDVLASSEPTPACEHYNLSDGEDEELDVDDMSFLADDLRSEGDEEVALSGVDSASDKQHDVLEAEFAHPVVLRSGPGKGYGTSAGQQEETDNIVSEKVGKHKNRMKPKLFSHKKTDHPSDSAAASIKELFLDNKAQLELLVEGGMQMHQAFAEAFGRPLITGATDPCEGTDKQFGRKKKRSR